MKYDKNFEKIVEILLGIEGGYSNHPNDRGGKTNYGITQRTYDAWRKMNNLPIATVENDLTPEEAKDIYYNMYWKESGADKYADPRDAMGLFDMAVISSPVEAIRMFNKSDNNFYTMLDNRKKYFDNIIKRDSKQVVFKDGWDERLKRLEINANKMIQEGFYKPSYYDELTPFDEGYNGNLNPVGDIPNRDAKRNKYQYNRNKAKEKGYIKDIAYDNFDTDYKSKNGYHLAQNGDPYFKRSLNDLAPWEVDDLIKKLI